MSRLLPLQLYAGGIYMTVENHSSRKTVPCVTLGPVRDNNVSHQPLETSKDFENVL